MLPESNNNDALFLDFDGTLVEIAARPADVIVPPSLVELLSLKQSQLDGALALISGRPVAELDQFLAPLRFVAAGEHGAELRCSMDSPVIHAAPLPPEARAQVQQMGARYSGSLVEIKATSAALHFRNAPEHQQAIVNEMALLAEQLQDYELLQGKMVAELKRRNVNKGIAIRELCKLTEFFGRRPVYIGDDATDEAGFSAVNELGGLSMRVGPANASEAQYSLTDVNAVHGWIAGTI